MALRADLQAISNCIHYYTLDNTLVDSIGTLDMVSAGSIGFDVDGIGSCIYRSNAMGTAHATSSSDLFGESKFSYHFLLKMSPDLKCDNNPALDYNAMNLDTLMINNVFLNPIGIRVYWVSAGNLRNGGLWSTGTLAKDNNWHQLIMTGDYSTGTYKVYINGSLMTLTTPLFTDTLSTTIDTNYTINTPQSPVITGKISMDEISLWKGVELTSEQVSSLFNSFQLEFGYGGETQKGFIHSRKRRFDRRGNIREEI